MTNPLFGAYHFGRCYLVTLVCLLMIVLWEQATSAAPGLSDRLGMQPTSVSVPNLPIIGTNILSMRSGVINVGSAVGVGLGGLYGQFGLELPLYDKYPHFWSLNFVLGTIYNLGFCLNDRGKSTGVWGGVRHFSSNLVCGELPRRLLLDMLGDDGMGSPGFNRHPGLRQSYDFVTNKALASASSSASLRSRSSGSPWGCGTG